MTTDLDGQDKDAAEIFPAFGAAGFGAVHWCQHWSGPMMMYDEAFARRVAGLAAASGLRVADVHAYCASKAAPELPDEAFLKLNSNRCEFAARLGADVLVIHVPLRAHPTFAQSLDHSAAMVERLGALAHPCGVRLAAENSPTQAALLDALFERFAPEDLGFCFDTGHALLDASTDLLDRHAGRLIATHLHDNDGTSDQHRLPGEGKVDWIRIARTLHALPYRRAWNLEVFRKPEMALDAFCVLARETLVRLRELPGPATSSETGPGTRASR